MMGMHEHPGPRWNLMAGLFFVVVGAIAVVVSEYWAGVSAVLLGLYFISVASPRPWNSLPLWRRAFSVAALLAGIAALVIEVVTQWKR